MLGSLPLANRIVMAPMTRNRADRQGVPLPLMAKYYGQRATAGLIITESAPIAPGAVGYPFTAGLYTTAQVEGWRSVVDAVHARQGRLFIQIQHCGRVSHPSLLPDQATPIAPSALSPAGQAVTYAGPQAFVTPRALDVAEIPAIVEQFRLAAERAMEAGFDGIEVHGANGYLIDQFLRDGSNQRADAYGGSAENRLRFLIEVLAAVTTVWPADRVGVRLSPENAFNGMSDSAPQAHFEFFAEQLGRLGLAYLHVLEGDMMSRTAKLDYRRIRARFGGVYMANNGYDLASAAAAIRSEAADLVAFGVPFVANPDLVHRFRQGLPLNEPDPTTFYTGGEKGYLDYPAHAAAKAW
jgi:N-ethylmaleimide reductase